MSWSPNYWVRGVMALLAAGGITAGYFVFTGDTTTKGDGNIVGNLQVGGTLHVDGVVTLPNEVNLGSPTAQGTLVTKGQVIITSNANVIHDAQFNFPTASVGKQFAIYQTNGGDQDPPNLSYNDMLLFTYNGTNVNPNGSVIERYNTAEPYMDWRMESNWLVAGDRIMELNFNVVESDGVKSYRPYGLEVDVADHTVNPYFSQDTLQLRDTTAAPGAVIETWTALYGWDKFRLTTNTTKKITITPYAAEAADRALYVPALGQDEVLVTAAYATVCQGRLTLTTGTPITTADVASSTSVYFTPYMGDGLAVPNTAGTGWVLHHFTELSCNNFSSLTADKNYDVFVWWNAAGGALNLSIGPAWSSDTARGTGAGTTELDTLNGVLVNKVVMLAGDAMGVKCGRYLGTVRSISTTATTDTARQRFVANLYNRVDRKLAVYDSTDTWSHANAGAFEAARNQSPNLNQVEVLIPHAWADEAVLLNASSSPSAAGTCYASVAIGVDSLTVASGTYSSTLLAAGGQLT